MNVKTDKRIVKTKTALQNALLSLLENQSLNTISITKLCETAKIDRNTFYCHYQIVEDVLNEVLVEHEKEIIKYISETAPDFNYQDMLFGVCDYIYRSKELSTLLLKNGFGFSYLQHITDASNKYILEIFKQSNICLSFDELQTINRYATGGTTILIHDWVLSGMKETPKVISDKLIEINTFVLNHYFNKS